MKTTVQIRTLSLLVMLLALLSFASPRAALSASVGGVDEDAEAALKKLYASDPSAKVLGEKAKAILVFPNIVKGGFMVSAQYGEGVLIQNGQVAGHYNIVAGSYGFQAGAQAFGYAMFLMTDKSIEYLNNTSGWEVGVGPSLVVVKKGMGKSITTATIKDDVYAYIFNQKGLMGGGGVQGSKITKITR